jgi:hypothetical protein
MRHLSSARFRNRNEMEISMKKFSSQSIGALFAAALALQSGMSSSAWAFGPARPSVLSDADLYERVQDASYPAFGVIHYVFQRGTPVTDLKQVKLNQDLVCKVDARHVFHGGEESSNSRPEVAIARLRGADGLYAFEKTSEKFVEVVPPIFLVSEAPNTVLSPITDVRKSEPIVIGMQDLDGVKRLAAFKLDLSGPMVTPEFRLTQSGALVIRVGELWDTPFTDDDFIDYLGYSYMFCK